MLKLILLSAILTLQAISADAPRVIPDQLYFPTLLKTISGARETIDILQFSFAISNNSGNIEMDSEPYKVAEALVKAKKDNPNLRIRLYIESERDTAPRNKITADYLKRNGIEVKEGKTHAKGFAVDGKDLLLGSTNLTTQSMRYNNETNVLLKDNPVIAGAFNTYFDGLWTDKPQKPEIFPQAPENGVQLLTNGKYKEELLAMIKGAKKTLDFSIYYFNDPDIEKALIEAQTKRKVKVRGYVNHHKTFAPDLVKRNKETVARMKEAGLNEIYFDRDTFFSHSKYLIADGDKFLLGTGNWNRTDVEEHPQVYLRIEDKEAADQLSRHLSQQIAYESDREIPHQLYYRFWVGNKKPELETNEFDRRIRERFVRATVKTGESGGLHAYLPALLAKPEGNVGKRIPDEVALVIYQDEPTYRAIRESPTGSVYGPLHMDYAFDTSSKSTVPEIYKGEVKYPLNEKGELLDRVAFDLSRTDINWQKGYSLFAYSPARPGQEPDLSKVKKYLDRLKAELGDLAIEGYTVLVGKDFLIEYFSRKEAWNEEIWKKVMKIKKETLGDTYGDPTHVETAAKTPYENNGIKRPTTFPVKSLTEKKGAGVINTKFAQAVTAQPFLDTSLSLFSLTKEDRAKLLKDIRDAFVNNTPVPTKDKAVPIEDRESGRPGSH